ncbi:MAG: SPOR domain-containing protein, partial [Xanthomonadales bacterium]|nr:SPOR domain-containing protein [Xanthomonadales bacterium]
ETEPVAAESPTEDAATTANEPTAPAPMPRGEVLGADEFARLPGSHYTVVLASVRDPATLDALIAAMSDKPGALYLLKLGMPDGDWYSLCWTEFDDVEAARAARVELPDVAGLSSGWPRRIGLLQAEIAKRATSP